MNKGQIEKRIRSGKGTFTDLQNIAQKAGEEMADNIINQLEEEFPGGNISEEDARSIVHPFLIENHKFITEMAALVINAMYKQNGVGIKAIIPEYNIDRENDLVLEIVNRSLTDGSA